MGITHNHMGLFALDLQLFDGAGGGSGAAAGAAGGGDAGQGSSGQEVAPPVSPRRNRNPLAHVKYGKQPDAMPAAQPQQNAKQESAPAEADLDAEWEELRNGRHKERVDAAIQRAVMDRFKGRQDAEQQMATLAPAIEALAKKHGKDATDLAGIVAAITDDDSLYEEEAIARGLPTDVVKTMHKLKQDNDALTQRESQRQSEMAFQQHFQSLAMQAEKLKQTIPGFDLHAELKNPRFANMTSPNGGVSVEDAYYAIHHKEIQQGAMTYAVQQTQKQVAQSIQAGQKRPSENGMRNQPAADVRDDPRKWSKADRAEVRRRIMMGEKIVL